MKNILIIYGTLYRNGLRTIAINGAYKTGLKNGVFVKITFNAHNTYICVKTTDTGLALR